MRLYHFIPILFLFLVLSEPTYAVIPRDYIEQRSSDTWFLHTFTQNEEGYCERIYEITSVHLRSISQVYAEDQKTDVSVENYGPVMDHFSMARDLVSYARNEQPFPNYRRIPYPLRRTGAPSEPMTRRSSRQMVTQSFPSPLSVISRQGSMSASSDGLPDFR